MASNQNDPARAGNEFFVRNEYEKALEAYSLAIDKYPDMSNLYSYRASTYLKLDRPLHAWKDLDIGLKLDPDSIKLIYRKCTTLLDLRRFHDAGQFIYESIGRLEHLTKNKKFKALVDKMNRLKMEYELGQYDLLAMIEESKTSKLLDSHADYIAWNKFEIREIEGKGRGLVAKEKIEAGELLIACKAFVFVDNVYEVSQSMDLPIDESMNLSRLALIEKAHKKLMDHPELAEQYYRLYAGPKLGHLDKWTDGESELIDMDRIQSIIRLNHLESNAIIKEPSAVLVEKPNDVGLWLTPSYINHTCVDTNCFRYFVGDYMFVRATKSIEKDEEMLFFCCACPYWPFEKRESACRDTYGFDCQCRLCVMDRQDSIEIKERMGEIRSFVIKLVEGMASINRHAFSMRYSDIEKSFRELWQIRPQRDLNYLAVMMQEAFAGLSYQLDKAESVRLLAECFEILRSIGRFTEALNVCKTLRSASEFMGENEQEKWKMEARKTAKLVYGDERLADLMFTKG